MFQRCHDLIKLHAHTVLRCSSLVFFTTFRSSFVVLFVFPRIAITVNREWSADTKSQSIHSGGHSSTGCENCEKCSLQPPTLRIAKKKVGRHVVLACNDFVFVFTLFTSLFSLMLLWLLCICCARATVFSFHSLRILASLIRSIHSHRVFCCVGLNDSRRVFFFLFVRLFCASSVLFAVTFNSFSFLLSQFVRCLRCRRRRCRWCTFIC